MRRECTERTTQPLRQREVLGMPRFWDWAQQGDRRARTVESCGGNCGLEWPHCIHVLDPRVGWLF
eukprot:3195599-Prymnesium_polylepis.2